MTLRLVPCIVFCLVTIISCTTGTVTIINEKKGTLQSSVQLVNIAEKKFQLDSVSALKPEYMQLYTDSNGRTQLTFLNMFTNSIYFYDYTTTAFLNRLSYDKKGPNGVVEFGAYYIRNRDSIYLFDRMKHALLIADSKGKVFSNISLINNLNINKGVWTYLYPQYYPSTATPMLATGNAIIFPGQHMYSVPKAILDTFRFTSTIALHDNRVSHLHRYPPDLYGNDYNWGRTMFTVVFSDLSANEGEIVYSFPISHDVYIASIHGEGYRTVYAGSNEAGDITSFDKSLKTKKELPITDLMLKVCQTDLYTAIKYDKYRKVFYRFLIRAIPNATRETTQLEKPVVVIVFDEKFNYLGETTIGKFSNYHWINSFVTQEGLHVEYIGNNAIREDQLTFKIFGLQKV